ncbi:hypothetical protein STAS_23402, partial [Striga asiatica]
MTHEGIAVFMVSFSRNFFNSLDLNYFIMDQESTQDVKPNNNSIIPNDSQNVQLNIASETPVQDSGSVSTSSNNNRKVSREDIELVQNLIERCLQLYMNRDEVVKTLLNRARIDPAFTTLGSIAIETSTAADVSPVMPPNGTISDMPVSPSSVASSGQLPFIGVENSGLDTAFTSDVASSVGLQLTTDNGAGNIPRDSLRSFDDIPWNFVPLNFCLSDLTADLLNLGDLGALGNYPGSPFLPSDSDILLDSPEQEDIGKSDIHFSDHF